jgi:hypothetical protein
MNPTDLAVDGTSVYFIDSATFTVNRVDKGGGTLTPLAMGQPNPSRLAQDDTYLYWSNAADGSVKRVRKTGGTPEPVASSGATGAITVDDSRVYWGGTFSCPAGGLVWGLYAATKDGSGASSLLTSCVYPFNSAYNGPVKLFVDSSFVYWSGPEAPGTPPNILEIDKTSGVVQFTDYNGKGEAMTVDDTSIYAIRGSLLFSVPHTVSAIDKTTHANRTVYDLPPGAPSWGQLTQHDAYLYRTGSGSGGVGKLLKCENHDIGQNVSPLDLGRIAVDDTYVYGIDGMVIRRAPK